jgi:hypothetical protein
MVGGLTPDRNYDSYWASVDASEETKVAVSGGVEDSDEPYGAGAADEPTPVMAERRFSRCLPCLGTGRLRLLGIELYETHRPCPYCKGAGSRIVVWRAQAEVVVADEMKSADVGRCKGAFHLGKRAAFGRVACTVCGGRFRPVQGLRVPNHVAPKATPKGNADHLAPSDRRG